MNELINANDNQTTIRWKLLTGASAVALACISLSGASAAGDADRPLIWLQASGQFDQLSGSQSRWNPEAVPGVTVGPLFGQYTAVQKKPRIGFDADTSISFQPEGSDWSLRASVRIGRARRPGAVMITRHLTSHGKYSTHYSATSHNVESHQVIDFQAGMDVGLGAAGSHAGSTIRAGVRIADLRSRSDVHVTTNAPISSRGTSFNIVNGRASRKFDGVGPSVSWDGSVPFAGTMQDGELALDWSAGAAFLFGRQTARLNTHATYEGNKFETNSTGYFGGNVQTRQEAHTTRLRSKNVTVPNLGASIGVSYRWPAARVSVGYRADIFFNALDGGVAASEKVNRGFFGPFVSMSVGLGD